MPVKKLVGEMLILPAMVKIAGVTLWRLTNVHSFFGRCIEDVAGGLEQIVQYGRFAVQLDGSTDVVFCKKTNVSSLCNFSVLTSGCQ